jgi:hypothetical protein
VTAVLMRLRTECPKAGGLNSKSDICDQGVQYIYAQHLMDMGKPSGIATIALPLPE